MGSSLHIVKNQALIANYSRKGVLFNVLSMVPIYSEGNPFVEGLLFWFSDENSKKNQKKTWLNRIFRRVFFNFSRYLLVQSVPKHLGLF